jgi:hypothetical protein
MIHLLHGHIDQAPANRTEEVQVASQHRGTAEHHVHAKAQNCLALCNRATGWKVQTRSTHFLAERNLLVVEHGGHQWLPQKKSMVCQAPPLMVVVVVAMHDL